MYAQELLEATTGERKRKDESKEKEKERSRLFNKPFFTLTIITVKLIDLIFNELP